jgi:xanthine dehydrogenase accessory factor
MKNLFTKLKEQQQNGYDCYLIALIETEGSTPRTSGAYMLVGARGLVDGTIGGGGMEYAAQQLAQKQLSAGGGSFVKAYDLSPRAGMACGGSCQVQFCYLPAGQDVLSLADEGLLAIKTHKPWWFLLPLGAGSNLPQIKKDLPLAGRRGILSMEGCDYYAEQYGYDGWVYVFGAGHVARELVPLLCHLGFGCVVLDDRDEFADAAVFPQAERVQRVDFAHLAGVCELGARDYAVVMTRGHVHDANCERFLLTTSVGYIGIMGSKNKAALARAALLSEGYSEQQLARVTTPIGIAIGSETPAEIAVSIAAQLIQVRAERA